MDRYFKISENNSNVSTEILAGFTTFFALSYIIFVNPAILSQTGMPWELFSLQLSLPQLLAPLSWAFANVPYAQAPGMGLNAFLLHRLFGLGFSWQQALAMVFLCGLINIIITVTKIRKAIIKSIPVSLQNAIGGGIGIFIAYIGIKNAGLINFTSDPGHNIILDSGTVIADSSAVPALVTLNEPAVLLAIIGLVLTVVLLVFKVKGAILIGIIATTIIGIPMGVVDISQAGTTTGLGSAFADLGITFGAALGSEGLGSLFSDPSKLPLVLVTIFSFSLADTFDTIGTFIGTGRQSGIFTEEDIRLMETSSGFKSKMDKALFADAIATSVGALFGTSNTTTYVESAAGISVGGRTGLTSVVTAVLLLACVFLAPVAGLVPAAATAPALIVVGIMMMSAFKEIKWDELNEASPPSLQGIHGFVLQYFLRIAAGFLFYLIVKICKSS